MWKDHSGSFLRYNRAAGISIVVSSLIASIFLSFLCSEFYNLWIYDIEQIIQEEGDWQGRLEGVEEEELLTIQNFAGVQSFRIYEEPLENSEGLTVDLWMEDPGTIYQALPKLAGQLEIEREGIRYHELLLSRYLIHDPEDPNPPLLLGFYLLVLLLVCVSLILIIRNAFEVSAYARIRQFGILSSIGATPGQIRFCLLQEAAVLGILPILAGSALGQGLSFLAVSGMERLAGDLAGRHEAVWKFHPAVAVCTLSVSAITVLISAWLPAWKLSRMTPLEAIRMSGDDRITRRKRVPVLGKILGAEGELAENGIAAHRKELRLSSLSLTLSFLGFTLMMSFFSLSELSTKYTYFERYQNSWDVMVSIKDAKIEDFDRVEALESLEGAADIAVYQKVDAVCRIPEKAVREVPEQSPARRFPKKGSSGRQRLCW